MDKYAKDKLQTLRRLTDRYDRELLDDALFLIENGISLKNDSQPWKITLIADFFRTLEKIADEHGIVVEGFQFYFKDEKEDDDEEVS